MNSAFLQAHGGADFDQDRLLAAVEGIGRAAANELELGWTHDDGPRPGEWYASARYKGTRVIVEDQHGPDTAAENLFVKLTVGGQCVACGGKVFTSATAAQVLAGGVPALACVWFREGAHWLRGCDGDHRPIVRLNRAQRRRQDKAKRLRR